MIGVKICGVNSDAAFDTTVECGADYLGFVFFAGSPRYVTPRQAAAYSARHVGGPRRVGLFVNPTPADVQAVLDVVPLDMLQIYGSPALCQILRKTFALPVFAAIGVAGPTDLPDVAGYADGLVIEAKPPAGATRPGGNALVVDWDILKHWRAPLPWILAGGLTAENVAQAIAVSSARRVDVSSGVESLPGVKSPALIRRFIANAHSAGRPAE